jgi:hypothetical protein
MKMIFYSNGSVPIWVSGVHAHAIYRHENGFSRGNEYCPRIARASFLDIASPRGILDEYPRNI